MTAIDTADAENDEDDPGRRAARITSRCRPTARRSTSPTSKAKSDRDRHRDQRRRPGRSRSPATPKRSPSPRRQTRLRQRRRQPADDRHGAEEVVGDRSRSAKSPRAIAFTPDGKTAYVSEERSPRSGSSTPPSAKKSTASRCRERTPGRRGQPGRESALRRRRRESGDRQRLLHGHRRTTRRSRSKSANGPTNSPSPPSGKTLYVAEQEADAVTPIDTATGKALTPIAMPGLGPWQLAVTPDLSPTAAFTRRASPRRPGDLRRQRLDRPRRDGRLLRLGLRRRRQLDRLGSRRSSPHLSPAPAPTRPSSRSSTTKAAASNASSPAAPPTAAATRWRGSRIRSRSTRRRCRSSAAPGSRIGGVSHNRKNGTVRLRLKFPTTGSFLLLRQEGPRGDPQGAQGGDDRGDPPPAGRADETAEEDAPRAGQVPHHLHPDRRRLRGSADRAPLDRPAAGAAQPSPSRLEKKFEPVRPGGRMLGKQLPNEGENAWTRT